MSEPAKKAGPPAPATPKPDTGRARDGATARPHSLAWGLTGFLLVMALFATAWVTWPLWNERLPGGVRTALAPALDAGRGAGGGLAARIESLERRFAAAEAEIASLRGEIAKRPAAVAGEGGGEELRRLSARADATDQAVTELRDKRLAAMEERVAALAAAAGERREAPPGADLAAIQRRQEETATALTALQSENRALTERLAALEKTGGAASRESAFVLAVGQLREAVRSGRPFADALGAARAIAGNDRAAAEAFAALEKAAAGGVPDLTTLRTRLAAAAPRIVAAGGANGSAGWFDQTLDRLSGLVTIRRTGQAAAAGTGPSALVARAELALAAGDLAGAVAALQGLTGAQAEAASPWLAGAKARLAAERAIAELDALAVGRLGDGGKPVVPGG